MKVFILRVALLLLVVLIFCTANNCNPVLYLISELGCPTPKFLKIIINLITIIIILLHIYIVSYELEDAQNKQEARENTKEYKTKKDEKADI